MASSWALRVRGRYAQATELINAGVVGIEAEATVETIGDSIAAHPTLGEAVKEAALRGARTAASYPAPRPRTPAAS